MAISKYLASYLTSIYQPVKVNIKNVFNTKFPYNYENEIFKLSINIIDNLYNINFYYSIIPNINSLDSKSTFIKPYVMPYTWLKNKILKETSENIENNLINFKVYKNNENSDNIIFNTNNKLPVRWLCLLKDFSDLQIDIINDSETKNKQDELQKNMEQIFNKYDKITLNNMFDECYKLSYKNVNYKIKIIKGPLYNDVLLNTHFYTKNNKINKNYLDELLELKLQRWNSAGLFSSVSTNIFCNRSKLYSSINYNNYKIMDDINGLDFNYVIDLPWYKLLKQFNIHNNFYFNGDYDTFMNTTSNLISLEEMLIFNNILKKEGCDIIYNIS